MVLRVFDRDLNEHSRQVRFSLMFQYLSIKVPVHYNNITEAKSHILLKSYSQINF